MQRFTSQWPATTAGVSYVSEHDDGVTASIADTSTSAQQHRLLARLKCAPTDTIVLRREENILAPASRVLELRKQGHNIITRRVIRHDEQGRCHHNVALYMLLPEGGPV